MRIPVVLAMACMAFLALMLSAVSGVEAMDYPTITVTASPSVFNPSSGTMITYTLSNTFSCEVVITITDASGNTILKVNNPNVAPGTYTYVWNGKDKNGNLVPDGNYKITVNGASIIVPNTYVMHSVAVYDNNNTNEYYVLLTLSDSPRHEKGLMDVLQGSVYDIGLSVPYGLDIVDVDGTHHFYVTDYDKNKTTIISGSLSGSKQEIDTLTQPRGIVADSAGNIYVTEYLSNKVQIFDKYGNSLRNIGVSGPNDVAVDGEGKIYVTSYLGDCVKIFNSNGSLYKTIGEEGVSGSDNYHFHGPDGIALDGSGNIYVADTFNYRIQVFNHEGRYLETIIISGTGYTSYPHDIDFDGHGDIYIIDSGNLIVSYAPGQTTVTAVTTPPTVTGISPTSGPTGGGIPVTITGTNFTGASAVMFGGTAATRFTVNSNTKITAVSPAGSAGTTVDVTVITRGGTSTTSSADQFSYILGPVENMNTTLTYLTIQAAIDDASPGDTLMAGSGVYRENVVVNKGISLVGDTSGTMPVVDGMGGTAITITADGVTLQGFNVTNSKDGIEIDGSNNNVTGNTVNNNNNGNGILLKGSNNNVTGNTANTNFYGIHLEGSSNNNVTGNTVNTNRYGIELDGSSNYNNVAGNTVNNNNYDGILLGSQFSSDEPSYNVLWLNVLQGNGQNAEDYESSNLWNSTARLNYVYDGHIYTNYMGNYWDDYGGADNDGDGIGDTPYPIGTTYNNHDNYPMLPGAYIISIAASFTANVTSGAAPLTVQFNDTSSGHPVADQWNYTIANSTATFYVTSRNFTYTFGYPGTYEVSLNASNSSTGIYSISPARSISISLPIAPVASFTATPQSGAAPLDVAFNDTSSGSLTSWDWSIVNASGNVFTTASRNFSYQFLYPDTYTVALTVRDAAGQSGSASQTVSVWPALHADFTSNISTGTAPLDVQFNDTSSGYPASWQWTIYNSSNSIIYSDTNRNITYTFNTPDAYTVMLQVANGTRSDSISKSITVNAPASLVASFVANQTGGTAPLSVQFNDTSSGSPVSWQWNFGNNSANVTTQNASYTYGNPGLYTVTLTAKNSTGASSTTTQQINVLQSGGQQTSYTLNLKQGWNLVSFPVVNYSVTASSLNGTGVLIVASYNRSTGDFDAYKIGDPIQYDITMWTDVGYFVFCTRDTSITIIGADPLSRSATINPGWNLIGWSSLNISTAKCVCNEPSLTVSQIVAKFNTTTGDFDAYSESDPQATDITMQKGVGYFMYTNSATPQTLYYEV